MLEYQEIYYASSEKGIFSGRPGFGVRTCTRGMASDEVDTIINACSPSYAVYNDRILDMEKITANPDVVYDYPPVYIYRTVEMNDGAKKYVLGRTVYLGVDYGYFKGINAYDRTGTNYFTHLFVFNEAPSASFLGQLIAESKFIPFNYSCSPSNVELQDLLTGTPEFLEPGTIVFDSSITELICPEDTELFLLGVAQMLKNQSLPAEMDVPRKMYVKCPWKQVEDCINTLSMFVNANPESFHYISNYMQGYGIPDGYDIVFVNEFNTVELYEDNYVTVDLFNWGNKNVENNYITERITDLIHQNELKAASQLTDFYLGLNVEKGSDYEFYYFVFLAAVSDIELQLENMPDTFIQKLTAVQLSEEQSARLWNKVNQSVNEGLISKNGKIFLLTLDRIKEMRSFFPEKIQIQEESVRFVSNILFNGKGNFGKIVNKGNVTTLLQLVDKKLILSEDLFLASLGESADDKVWDECVEFYYNGNFVDIEPVLVAVLHSKLPDEAVDALITKFFPLERYADKLFDYFKNNSSDIVRAKQSFMSLIDHYGEKRFSDFIQMSSLEPKLQTVVSQAVTKYYSEKIDSDLYAGVRLLFGFIDKTGVGLISKLDMWPMLRTAADRFLNEPIKDIQSFVNELNARNISFPAGQDGEIKLLTSLVNRTVPRGVGKAFAYAAFRNYHDDAEYFTKVFMVWLQNGASNDDVKEFISASRNKMSLELVASLLNSIWKCSSLEVINNREAFSIAVLDNCGWSRDTVEDFGQKCRNKELKDFVLRSNTIFNRVLRKIFK